MKTRFCPSPTGLIHLGNARTALFNALLAKHANGCFLLRIEDTDNERSTEEFAQTLMHDLCWLQAKWDEGPDIGGEYGPYWQAERTPIYDRYYKKLQDNNLAYLCFCSEAQLQLSRQTQRAAKQAPRYAGTCSCLTTGEIEKKIAQGLQPNLRFRVPQNKTIEFNDAIKGKQTFNSNDIGDFIIRRSSGAPSFMFANAIDDALMQVTDALRGEDHLTNTPRQLMILQALNLTAPQYGHLSLITGNDNSPLAKRHGSKSLQELRNTGWLAIAVVNYLARLGHYYSNNTLMDFTQLAKEFNITHLSHSPAKYDPQQMLYWQKEALNHISNSAFWNWLIDNGLDATAIPKEMQDIFITAIKPNTIFPKDAIYWSTIFFNESLNLNQQAIDSIKQAGAIFFNTALDAVNQFDTDIKAIADHIKNQCQIKGKALFMPLRFALTGDSQGPELAALSKLLNKTTILKRLQTARGICDA